MSGKAKLGQAKTITHRLVYVRTRKLMLGEFVCLVQVRSF